MKKFLLGIPFAYFSLVLIWGSTWIAIKVSVGDVPFIMAAIRFFIAAIVLIIFQSIRKKPILPPSGNSKVILVLGVGTFFIGYGFTYWGMQYVHSNVSSILWAIYPIVVSITAHFMLSNDRINTSKIFSLLGALIGSYLIFDFHGHKFDPQAAIGMLVILISIGGAAYSNVLYKREGSHLDPVSTNAIAMLIGASLLIFPGLIFEPWQQIEFNALTISAIGFLAVMGSAIGFSVYFWLLGQVTVVKMSYTNFLLPIIASFWGWLLLGEVLSPSAFVGAIIILLAVSLPEFWARNRGRSK